LHPFSSPSHHIQQPSPRVSLFKFLVSSEHLLPRVGCCIAWPATVKSKYHTRLMSTGQRRF